MPNAKYCHMSVGLHGLQCQSRILSHRETHLPSFRGGALNHCAPAGKSGTASPPPLRSMPSMKRLNAARRSAAAAPAA